MGQLTFTAKFHKNSGLILNPQELLDLYFYGVAIIEPSGTKMPMSTIEHYIRSSQEQVEKWLGIKFQKQIIKEQKDFDRNDWYNWGYIRTTYPAVKALSLEGFIGETKQITYPAEWLNVRKTNDGELYHRHVYLVPSSNSPSSTQVVYTGIAPHLSLTWNQRVPNYWSVEYETGFCKVPSDLLEFVGLLSAIRLFHVMGDLILGAGIASQSISIDGLSQAIATTSSATNAGYGSRILGYVNEIKQLKEMLYNYYKGFTFSAF